MKMRAVEEEGAILGETIERAVEFHGHIGPFLVLGLRMGLLASRELFLLEYGDDKGEGRDHRRDLELEEITKRIQGMSVDELSDLKSTKRVK